MAELALGLASSHTPQLSTSADYWTEHAARDQRNPRLLGPDGRYYTYDELLATAAPALAGELQSSVWRSKFDRAQAAVEVLAQRLAAAEPDVVVIVGDDQHELFGADGIPAIGLFTGEALWDLPPDAEHLAQTPADIRAAAWAAHADAPDRYPVAADLSEHLARVLTGREFDLTVMSQQPAGRSLGHAFTFVHRRLRLAAAVPIVPVLLNTYFPPNVPSPGRCWRLGEALRAGSSPGRRPPGSRSLPAAGSATSWSSRISTLDSPQYGALTDPEVRELFRQRGSDPDQLIDAGIEMDNAIIDDFAGVTFGLHICRGNAMSRFYASGSYEPLARIFTRSRFGRFLLEYDDRRSGGFGPLRHVPEDRVVVLGLVTTKKPQLEDADVIRGRIAEAARFVPLDRLALSPQCGFASVAAGNLISPAGQAAKLALVADVAGQVWG
jgi:Cobalamin-independent synthase, Catalytic domain